MQNDEYIKQEKFKELVENKFKLNVKCRQKERIKPFLDKLEKVWDYYHDMRFMQLIFMITRHPGDCFHMEEDEFLKLLEEYER